MIDEVYRADVRTSAQTFGDEAEGIVAAHLVQRGWSILGRNIRLGRGELDLAAIDPGPPAALVVVEVRWRGGRGFGMPEETVDHRKRSHLRVAIGRLLDDGLPHGVALPPLPIRVDLIVVEPGIDPGAPPVIRHHRAIAL